MIGYAERNAPVALQILNQAFRTPHQTEKLKGVLAGNVKMSAVGWINNELAAFESETPDKVIELFKSIVTPAGAVLTGGGSDIEAIDDNTWQLNVIVNRKINEQPSNIQISVTCTLANNLISNIAIEV